MASKSFLQYALHTGYCLQFLYFSIAGYERSFSKLNFIKTFIRPSMSQEWLTNLAIISIEKEYLSSNVKKKKIVEHFSERRDHLGHRN